MFDKKNFDDGEKNVLGQKGKFDSESAIDVILAQPAASKHLARNLLIEFVHPEPTAEQVDHYAQRVVANEWSVKKTLREMLTSRMFFSDWAYRSRIKDRWSWPSAGLAMGGKVNRFLREQCGRLGQNLLIRRREGWPGDKVWINANTVLLRFNFAMQMATQRQRSSPEAIWTAGSRTTRSNPPSDVLNYFAALMLDGKIEKRSPTTLLDYMNRDQKGEAKPFKLTADSINSKVRGLMHMMMTMPEYQLA